METYETYSESAEGVTITFRRAMQECREHNGGHDLSAEDMAAFIADLGEHAEYDAGDVLRWLGY